MALIESFRDLEVYKLALKESKKIFMVTKEFPKEEKYSLTDQIRRSSRAVNALVAESWARRLYKAAFINYLRMEDRTIEDRKIYSLFSILYSLFYLLSSIFYLLSSIFYPRLFYPLSSIFHLLSSNQSLLFLRSLHQCSHFKNRNGGHDPQEDKHQSEKQTD